MLTIVMTTRYITVAMTSGVQIPAWEEDDDMVWTSECVKVEIFVDFYDEEPQKGVQIW